MGPCPICSKRPLSELIDLKGRIRACPSCMEGYRNLKRVYDELLGLGLSETEADKKICAMLEGREL